MKANFMCPITRCYMAEPAVGSDGHTYEYEAIVKWRETSSQSPLTKDQLKPEIYKNLTLKKEIQSFIQKNRNIIDEDDIYLPEEWKKKCLDAIKNDNLTQIKIWSEKDPRLLNQPLQNNQPETTAIYLACKFNSYQAIKYFIAKFGEAKAKDIFLKPFQNRHNLSANLNECLLTVCEHLELISFVEPLIALGAAIDFKNECGRNSLMIAILKNNREAYQILLNNGADIYGEDDFGYSTITYLATLGLLSLLKDLHAKNSLSLMTKSSAGLIPLLIAAENGHLEMLQWYVKKGLDLAVADHNGNNAMHLAAKEGHRHIVKWLLRALLIEQSPDA